MRRRPAHEKKDDPLRLGRKMRRLWRERIPGSILSGHGAERRKCESAETATHCLEGLSPIGDEKGLVHDLTEEG